MGTGVCSLTLLQIYVLSSSCGPTWILYVFNMQLLSMRMDVFLTLLQIYDMSCAFMMVFSIEYAVGYDL